VVLQSKCVAPTPKCAAAKKIPVLGAAPIRSALFGFLWKVLHAAGAMRLASPTDIGKLS
jgi:hypothetical protein